MFEVPPKLLSPAPRNISASEDFLGRSRILLWTKAAIWPAIGAFIIFLEASKGSHMMGFTLFMFSVFTVIGVAVFFAKYSSYKKIVRLLNEGIMCNGYVQYHSNNFWKGTKDFEMIYTHPLTGGTFKGTVGLAYYNKLKYPLHQNAIVPLIIDPADPGKFTIWVPKCALTIGRASWF